jgi:biotin-(acetyl-CoA carboxylase) ligase
MAAAFVLAELLRNRWNLDATVKWPNDVLVNNRKIAGVLGKPRWPERESNPLPWVWE